MANGLAAWIVGIGLGLLPLGGTPDGGDAPREVTRTGTVVELAPLLAARGVIADAGLIAEQVVLKGDDGTVTPLVSNTASRALFRDERLRDRPAEVTGLVREGLPYLEVVTFRVEEQGKLRTPEYHCDICAISVRYPQACPCCQGSMELRFKPAPEGQ